MIKTGCQCFMCRHRDEPRLLTAYCEGYKDASMWFINWAKKKNIPMGSIADDDLSGIYAQMSCNYGETCCIMADLPDIEDDNERKDKTDN